VRCVISTSPAAPAAARPAIRFCDYHPIAALFRTSGCGEGPRARVRLANRGVRAENLVHVMRPGDIR
jgi:hypothetical protein